MTYDGTFITIEGVDGSGTSSAVGECQRQIENAFTVCEPTPFWTGHGVRKALKEDSKTPPLTDFFLFMADRAYNIENVLKPNLKEGKVVISDRYADSTRAYQKIALTEAGVVAPEIYIEMVHAELSFEPDLTLLIDVDVEESFGRTDGDEKYEKELGFQKEVAANYREIARNNPDRFVVIDGNQPKDAMIADVIEEIENFI